MSNNWYNTRTIETLMKTFDAQAFESILAGMLASIAVVISLFRPIIAITQSLHSGETLRLSPGIGYIVMLIALISVILSVKSYLQIKMKRVARGIIVVMSLIALVSSVISIFADGWLLHLYINLC